MALLLDTHIWLWMQQDKDRIPFPVRRRLSKPAVSLYLSAACVMEMSIKMAIGKLRIEGSVNALVDRMQAQGVIPLSVTIEHAISAGNLPLHHRDPFDRTLIAQARVEGLTLVTADPRILQYDVSTIDARK
jgi:PIN domain nuclease of toxin-antitoxin system